MKQLLIDCTTGESQVLDMAPGEATVNAIPSSNQVKVLEEARQRQADLDAIITQYRTKATTEPVTGKQPT